MRRPVELSCWLRDTPRTVGPGLTLVAFGGCLGICSLALCTSMAYSLRFVGGELGVGSLGALAWSDLQLLHSRVSLLCHDMVDILTPVWRVTRGADVAV